MRLELLATVQESDKEWKDRVVVVIDVLRATSTIITAIANGCREIIPVEEVSEAVALQRRLGPEATLLGGERNAQRIDGFQLSNSPLEYTSERVRGHTIILTTSNGTRAIKRAHEGWKVVMAALINADAVAAQLAAWNRDVVLLCAGTHDRFSMDDVITAGSLISALQTRVPLELDDLSIAAYMLYQDQKSDLLKALSQTTHCKFLLQSGYAEDVDYCLQLNSVPVIPVYHDGIIRRLTQ